MPADLGDTCVTFPQGGLAGEAAVAALLDAADVDGLPTGSLAVVVDRTPFHPLDHTWPDQPADRGTVGGIELSDCMVGAVAADGAVFAGEAIPARRGDPDWHWVVLHVLPADAVAQKGLAPGGIVDLVVEADLRARYSRGHSACHLAALALNQAAVDFWDKDPGRPDSLGNPDLDALAITESRIEPDAALDVYRLGRSIRRKGLRSADLLAALPDLAMSVNDTLRTWTASAGSAAIETGGDERLTARRRWTAVLPVGRVEIPCGGTHVTELAEIAGTTVTYEPVESGFRALTHVPRPAETLELG